MPTATKAHAILPRTVIAAMATAANDAIDNALLVGSPGMISRPRTEVGFVAAVTLGAIWDIANAWTALCKGSGLAIDLSGIFCHAAPMVKFLDSKRRSQRCELADLLIVVDVKSKGVLTRRAALIQAKMARAAERVSLSGKSSRTQLALFQNWPPFDFEEAVYRLKAVDFTKGAGAPDSGTFGVIDRHFKSPPIWTQHPASPTPAVVLFQPSLGDFIAEMVDGSRADFGRLATPALKTDWSKTVERLLEITYGRAFHHKATLGPTGAPRGVNAVACLSFNNSAALQNQRWTGWDAGPPRHKIIIREDDGEPSGISVVHIGIGPAQED